MRSESDGLRSLCRVNERCIDQFPSAAELVMGRSTAAAVSLEEVDIASAHYRRS